MRNIGLLLGLSGGMILAVIVSATSRHAQAQGTDACAALATVSMTNAKVESAEANLSGTSEGAREPSWTGFRLFAGYVVWQRPVRAPGYILRPGFL